MTIEKTRKSKKEKKKVNGYELKMMVNIPVENLSLKKWNH